MDSEPVNPSEIMPGSQVSLHLSLSLPDGTEAVSTFGEEPLSLVMGDGTLLPGMEMALYGLSAGDEQTLTLEPHQAYGFHDEQMTHELPRSDFGDHEPEAGHIMAFATPGGDETPGLVLEVHDDKVKVDFNHPLAGREVVFRVQVLEVANGPALPIGEEV